MRGPIRLILLLDLAAAGAVVALLLVTVGVPLAAHGTLRPSALSWLVLGAVLAGGALGVALLFRSVARPVDRILAAADRLGAGEAELPILHPPGEVAGHGLHRAAVAFERLAAMLAEERGRLAQKIQELERTNRELAQAREGLFRSERLAAVGQLAAGVAHEVGNPLGAVQGYAELARARLADGAAGAEAAQDYLGRICVEAQRIDAIVRGLLDFARATPPELGPVAVAAAVDAAARLARVQERLRGVTIDVELPADLPPVRADASRLSQVFLNLLLNAADAMEGEGRVTVRGRVEGAAVVVEVQDTGPGIPGELLPRIFDPFFTTKPPGQGTGLGLAVCHGILESMEGRIEASDGHGGGACFTVRLPAAPGAAG